MAQQKFSLDVTVPGEHLTDADRDGIAKKVHSALTEHFASKPLLKNEDLSKLTVKPGPVKG
jgi:hypothetical protein